MKVLEGKGIYISSQSDPWKHLHRMVRILYSWHSLLFEDSAYSWTQKLFNVRIRAKNVAVTFVATFLLVCLSNYSFTAFIPSAFGIFLYNDLTSRDTKLPLSGTGFIAPSFHKKSVLSFIYEDTCLTIG